MITKPLAALQVGDIAYLEGCGIVRVLFLEHFPTWVEVVWDRHGTGVLTRPSHAQLGTWSAFYDDYPAVPTYPTTKGEPS